MKNVKLSIAPKTSNPANAVWFQAKSSSASDLQEILTTNTYSPVVWKIDPKQKERQYNRYRREKYFESASGFVIDIDEGLSIEKARRRLEDAGLNYVIITSNHHRIQKRDKPPADRYHIIVFFDQPTTSPAKYRESSEFLYALFPEMDCTTRDLARFIFASPEDAEYYEWDGGEYLDLDSLPEYEEFTDKSKIPTRVFDYGITVTLENGQSVPIVDIKSKTIIRCPFPGHEDRIPSAFADYLEGKGVHMIYCSKCNCVGWPDRSRFEVQLSDRMSNLYFLSKDIIEMGLSERQFYATKLARDAFEIVVGANNQREKASAFRNLVETRRLANLHQVRYVGDPEIEGSDYSVDLDKGIVTARIAATPEKVHDNIFIEDFLKQVFGRYASWVKRYLAMYAYTNYQHLPTLVLYGGRGTGKSTFGQLVSDIYPSLATNWSGHEGNFTPEAEKKLATVEENETSDDKGQYKTLKKYTGQPYLRVNNKYQPEYLVPNNLNIILISNEPIPLFVEKREMPTDESNNQFFVWEFPGMEGPCDASFGQKLRDRLGHYVRTELKQVFESVGTDYTRYGIPVPITDAEKRLFANNATNIEMEADLVLERIHNDRENMFGKTSGPIELVSDGYLPVTLVTVFSKGRIHPNTIIKNLKKRGIISQDSVRKINGRKKYTCYEILAAEVDTE